MSSVDPIRAELDALRSELAALRAERAGDAEHLDDAPGTARSTASAVAAEAQNAASAAARRVTGWLDGLDVGQVLRELQDALGEASAVAEQSVANRPVVIVGSALLLGFLLGRLTRGTR